MTSRAVPYLIAEIGVNHDGEVERARDMTVAAAEAGFDAVKYQYWNVDELLAANAPAATYQNASDQHSLLSSLRLDLDALAVLRKAAVDAGIEYGVTPDGPRACREIATLRPDFVKIGSGDMDNPWLLEEAVALPQALVVSTGMAAVEEVEFCAARLRAHADVTFLHCVSAYPTPVRSANLARMRWLAEITGRPVGWSDHTVGSDASVAAVALGAVIVEKHVTWDVTAHGPDHSASLPLEAAAEWVHSVRDSAYAAHACEPEPGEAANRRVVRKALYLARDLPAGHVLGRDDLVSLRPLGDGLPAWRRDSVIGSRLRRPVRADTPLTTNDLA